jgi:3'(2'), 5'-bisphosphate nucleotidase
MQLPSTLLRESCELARLAGEKIMSFYREGFTVAVKEDASPLTSADTAAHEFLAGSLASVLPGVPIVSEESRDRISRKPINSETFWLVDPLDGTKEFVKRTNEFTVNIALLQAGRPVLGVVHAPALDLTYSSLLNVGAWRQTGSENPVPITTRRAIPPLSIVASKDHAGPLVEKMLSRLSGATRQSMGSSLKFCLIAEGKADVYLRDQPTMEWDTAAAHCVVEAAGGRVCTLDGETLRYEKPDLKNPAFITLGDPQLDWTPWIR